MNWTQICLVIASLFEIGPGLIHYLAEDGGAGSIAGIVLEWDNSTSIIVGEQVWGASNYHKQSILVMFSALGVTQIKLGVVTIVTTLLLTQGIVLCFLTWSLMGLQVFTIIGNLVGSRHIHTIASTAPGGYKEYLLSVIYLIATILQVIWYCKQDEVSEERKKRTL